MIIFSFPSAFINNRYLLIKIDIIIRKYRGIYFLVDIDI